MYGSEKVKKVALLSETIYRVNHQHYIHIEIKLLTQVLDVTTV